MRCLSFENDLDITMPQNKGKLVRSISLENVRHKIKLTNSYDITSNKDVKRTPTMDENCACQEATHNTCRCPRGEVKRKSSLTPASLLCYAVIYRDSSLLERLVQTYKSNINDLNDDGVSAIHLAALDGNLTCIDILCENGGAVDVVDSRNVTPLEYAVRSGQFDAASRLIQRGADASLVQDGIMF